MRNLLLILLAQQLPTRVRQFLKPKKPTSAQGQASKPPVLQDIDRFFPAGVPPRRALVMLRPDIWLTAVKQHPNITLYNHYGFVFSLVKALNESGYIVDLVDSYTSYQINHKYDLFIGHGGHCKPFLDQLPPDIPVFQYISGLYWKVFDVESDERYERFFSHYGASRPTAHRRSITSQIEGLEYLNERADVMFTIHCPRMVAAYGRYSSKFHFTGLGAYLDELFVMKPGERDFDDGRKNFIYVGGTGGNLQKGLDLLIEAFQETPDLHLYIYCKVEEEILKHCRKELAAPNIHYIYHWKYRPFHGRLRELLKRTNFSVHAPINIGMGTAFMATMGAGMVPVGFVDIHNPGESAVLCDSWKVKDLVECIRRASRKSPEWCENASRLTVAKYQEHCDPEQVEKNFVKMFSALK